MTQWNTASYRTFSTQTPQSALWDKDMMFNPWGLMGLDWFTYLKLATGGRWN